VRPAWVAGAVRARLLARRRLGRAGAREVATAPSLGEAVARVAASPYGREVTAGSALADAQHGVRAVAAWHLRVLAGWLAPGGAETVRLLAGGHEIADVEAHLGRLTGGPAGRTFELGALATAWSAVARAASPAAVRGALRASAWGDPGTDDTLVLGTTLRLVWARRVADGIPALHDDAVAAAAVVVARERFGRRRALSPPAVTEARRLLGARWEGAGDLDGFVARLAPAARRPFVDVDLDDVGSLWRSEARWVTDAEARAGPRLRRSASGPEVASAAGVLLLVDAWRTCGALEAAAWGAAGTETFDAVA